MTEHGAWQKYDAATKTPVGWVGVLAEEGCVTRVDILGRKPDVMLSENPTARQACSVLDNYFGQGDWKVDLPLAPKGTPFQQKVWEALQLIPNGRTITYGELARQLGTSARAIGGACRANPIPLLIPCHRVLAAKDEGGFSGHRTGPWLEIKRWLLDHEQ